MKKILVPTDFSEEADNALEVACIIARKTGATIDLLHIIEEEKKSSLVSTGTYLGADGMDKLFTYKLIEKAQKLMEKRLHQARFAGVRMHQGVKVGALHQEITMHSEKCQSDLIVMGTKGINSLFETLTGSNTDKIVRSAKCMVLSIKEMPKNFVIRSIVIPTNFEEKPYRFLYKIKKLQNIFDFQIHLVYVNSPLEYRTTSEINSLFRQFIKDHELKDYETHIIDEFPAEKGIIEIADQLKADLIAITTHGRQGISHFFHGSITEDLVNYTNKPVLSFNIKK